MVLQLEKRGFVARVLGEVRSLKAVGNPDAFSHQTDLKKEALFD